MKIAILGWGSLVWDQRELPTKGDWKDGGPSLPIEFSRVSKDGRLTLVIDQENGMPTETCFVLSARLDLMDTVADLRDREGTVSKRIGFLNTRDGTKSIDKYADQEDVFQIIQSWAEKKNIDAVVWTALLSQFKEQTGNEFSVEHAICHVKSLPKSARKIAIEYIVNAPSCIKTPFRDRSEELNKHP